MRPLIHCIWSFSVIALGAAQPCLAQCTRWDTEFSASGLTTDDPTVYRTVFAIAEFDDGSGPALFVGGSFTAAGGVSALNIAKWNGTSWSALGSGMECSPGTTWCYDGDGGHGGSVRSLIVFDDGSGPALYAGGEFSVAGGVSALRIAKWNGTSWSSLGSTFDDWVVAMAIYDDGSGPALYAGGYSGFEATGQSYVAKWNGTNWSEVAGRFDGPVLCMANLDDGSGRTLYVGGFFTNPESYIAKWDGNAWSPVGSGLDGFVRWLTTFDSGSGPTIYAGGLMGAGSVTGNVQRWDGATWSAVGSGLKQQVKSLAVFDDGSGPALYASGNFRTDIGSVADLVAKWDGSTWSSLGGSLSIHSPMSQGAEVLAVPGAGSERALYVGGDFTRVGTASAECIAKWLDCSPGFVQCFGDGFDSLVTTPCPCGNFGDRRNGCANSNPALGGAHLDATGTKSPNTVLLSCTGIPNGNLCTFLRSTGNNPLGAVFGDGVSCISGPIVRFGQQFAGQDWNEPYTVQAEPVAVAPGNTRYYAVQYRNPAPAFCPGGAFNVSNGYVIHW